ncbi:MAG: ATP-binding protein, partial [Bacteriovoracia bacterium]
MRLKITCFFILFITYQYNCFAQEAVNFSNNINTNLGVIILSIIAMFLFTVIFWIKSLYQQIQEKNIQLQATEDKFQAFFNNSSVGMAIIDTDLRYLAVNHKMAFYNKRLIEDHIGKSLYEIIPFCFPTLAQDIKKVIADKQILPSKVYTSFFQDTQQSRNLLLNFLPLIDMKTDCVSAIGIVAIDITQEHLQKQKLIKELKINKSLANLYPPLMKQNTDMNSVCLEILKNTLSLVPSDLGLVTQVNVNHCNKKLFSKFGQLNFQNELIIEDNLCPHFISLHENDKNALFFNDPSVPLMEKINSYLPKPLFNLISIPIMIDETLSGQIVLMNKKEGNYTFEDVQLITRVAYFFAIALQREFDSLEKEEARNNLYHASKLASIGELAAGVGHEINTPLTVIRGNTELAINEVNKPTPQIQRLKNYLNNQNNALERIQSIVKGLRIYARKGQSDKHIVDVNNAIDDTLSLIQNLYFTDDISIVYTPSTMKPLIWGDQGKLQQGLINSLSNAKDAIKEIRRSGKIEIETKIEQKDLKIHIIDNGKGIAKETFPKLFDPFFTTKPKGIGTGLGLSISNSIIKGFGGSIEFKSTYGEGCKQIITLPLHEVENVTLEISPSKETTNILIVDDEESLLEIIVEELNENGYNNIDTAPNGKEALSKLKNKSYNLLITDIKMPILNGIELIKKTVELNLSDKLHIIVITGGIPQEMYSEAQKLEKHVKAVLNKPFATKELVAALNSFT